MLHEIRKRKVRAAILARNGHRQAQGIGRFLVIRGECPLPERGSHYAYNRTATWVVVGMDSRNVFSSGNWMPKLGEHVEMVPGENKELHVRQVARQALQANDGLPSVTPQYQSGRRVPGSPADCCLELERT